MQVGTIKDQGLYNKSSAAVHPGALAAGTLPHNIPLAHAVRMNETVKVSAATNTLLRTLVEYMC